MESHYCRASSSKLYLEPLWTSHAAVYKEYVVQCREKGVTFMSRKTFSEVFSSKNIALYSPKKDHCDICTMHSYNVHTFYAQNLVFYLISWSTLGGGHEQ